MKLLLRTLTAFLLGLAITAAMLFLPAGTGHYPGAWLFMALLFIPILIMGVVLLIKNPELLRKRLEMKEREKGIAVRQALTNALQQSGENERMHNHAYSLYTDIIYKVIFGKTAKQLREEYGITKKDSLRDYLSKEELEKVQSIEMIVSGLINCGWGYDEVKNFITNQSLKLGNV